MAADTAHPRPQYAAARSSHSPALVAWRSSSSSTALRSAACARLSLENTSWLRSSRSARLARASSGRCRRWYTIDRLIALVAIPSAPSRSPLRRYASALRLASIIAASPDRVGTAGGGATQAARNASEMTASRGSVAARIASSAFRARSRRFEAVHRKAAHGFHFEVVAQQPGVARRTDDVLAVAYQLAAVAHQGRHLNQHLVQGIAVLAGRLADLRRGLRHVVQGARHLAGETRYLALELTAHPPQRGEGRLGLTDHGVGVLQHLARFPVGLRQLLKNRARPGHRLPEFAVRLIEVDQYPAQVPDHRRELRLQIVDQLGDPARGHVLDLVSLDDRLQRMARLSARNELDGRRADVALAEEPRTRGLGHTRRVVADDRELHPHPAVGDVEVAHGPDGKAEQPHRHALVDPERVGRVKIDRGVAHENSLLVADQKNPAVDPEQGR